MNANLGCLISTVLILVMSRSMKEAWPIVTVFIQPRHMIPYTVIIWFK